MSAEIVVYRWAEPHDRKAAAAGGRQKLYGFPAPTVQTFARLYDFARKQFPKAQVAFVQRSDVNRGKRHLPSTPWRDAGKGNVWPGTRGPKALFWRSSVADAGAGDAMLEAITSLGGEDPFVWSEPDPSGVVLLASCLHEGLLWATEPMAAPPAWRALLTEVGMVAVREDLSRFVEVPASCRGDDA